MPPNIITNWMKRFNRAKLNENFGKKYKITSAEVDYTGSATFIFVRLSNSISQSHIGTGRVEGLRIFPEDFKTLKILFR